MDSGLNDNESDLANVSRDTARQGISNHPPKIICAVSRFIPEIYWVIHVIIKFFFKKKKNNILLAQLRVKIWVSSGGLRSTLALQWTPKWQSQHSQHLTVMTNYWDDIPGELQQIMKCFQTDTLDSGARCFVFNELDSGTLCPVSSQHHSGTA